MLKSGLDCLVCSTAVGTPHLVEREGRAVFELFRQPQSGWQTILKLTYQVPGTNLSTLGRRAHLERQGRAVGFEVLRREREERERRERGEKEERERREREEREGERETRGYEPFALHASIHQTMLGYVMKSRTISASAGLSGLRYFVWRVPPATLNIRKSTCGLHGTKRPC